MCTYEEAKELMQAITLYQEKPVKKKIEGRYCDVRIDRNTIPEGMFAYDIREGDSGYFCTIESNVVVNHAGTVLFNEPLAFPSGERITLIDDGNPDAPYDADWSF